MVRRTYVVRDGKLVEGRSEPREAPPPFPGQGDPAGHTVQLPKNYPYAPRHDSQGRVAWTTRTEARDIAKRAQDHGEGVWFDR